MPVTRFAPTLLALACFQIPGAGFAQEPAAGPGFWGAVDIGYASLRRSYSVTARTTDSVPSLALRAGFAVDPRLLLGVETGGWTLENSQMWDPGRGEGIETVFAIAQYYPRDNSGWYLKGGGGAVRYWNNRPSESGANGTGYALGIGYDAAFWARLYFTSAIDFSWGRYDGATSPPGVTQNQSYRAVGLKIGLTFR